MLQGFFDFSAEGGLRYAWMYLNRQSQKGTHIELENRYVSQQSISEDIKYIQLAGDII